MLEDLPSKIHVQCVQVVLDHPLSALPLRFCEQLLSPEDVPARSQVVGAVGDVLVCVVPTVTETVSAEGGLAASTSQSEAAVEIKEGLTAARALECEDLFADVLVVALHLRTTMQT